jgi:tetratricopeptide (TPR) repeat protein/S1-C subfamily serine protease
VGDNTIVDVVFPVAEKGQIVASRAWYLEHYPRLQEDGYAVRGTVLRRELATDLALVELASLPVEAMELGLATGGVSPGDRVFVVGTRYDSDALWGFTAGTVRGSRVLREGYFNGGKQLAKGARVIEATAPINEGDSGGPLVNDRGEVVGVCAAVAWEALGAGLFTDRQEVLALLERAGRKTRPIELTVVGAGVGREVYRRAMQSVALVLGADSKHRATGFIVDRQRRLLLTTAETVGRREKMDVVFPTTEAGQIVGDVRFYLDNEKRLRAKGGRVVGCVLATDARRNLALVELASIPEDVVEMRIAQELPAPGESVHAVGSPQGADTLWLYNGGWVRQAGHANLGQTMDEPNPAVLLVQAPVAEGEGGGPLLNDKSQVVGLVTGKSAPQQQIAYALTASEIKDFLAENKAKWEPHSAAEWCARGLVFVKARLYDRALLDYNAALGVDPAFAQACSDRSHLQHLRGRDDLALADAERAIRLDDKLASAYVHRAAVRTARGDHAEAAADCDIALRLDRDHALAHAVRAEARRQLGDLDRALTDAEVATVRDPKSAAAYLVRGRILAQKGDHARAIEDFGRTLLYDPESSLACRLRADSHWARSDVAAALDDYNRTLALNADDARAHHGRGRALAARKEYDDALVEFNAASRLDARLAPVYLDRGGELLRRGDVDHGLADFESALRLDRRLVADVLAEVERRVNDLVRRDPDDRMGAFALCRRTFLIVQPHVKDRAEARKILEAGLAIMPDKAQVVMQTAKMRELLTQLRAVLRD